VNVAQARVIAVINQKGGAGKTTVAMHLAAGLARRAPAVVVDLDPQASATQWAAAGTQPFPATVKQLRAGAATVDLRRDYRGFDFVVLDCPPAADSRAAELALRCCDVAVIPVLPSPVDLWASLRLPQHIDDARQHNPALRAWLLLNQIEARSALSAAMQGALAEFGLPVLRTPVRRRGVYKTAALEGVSAYQMGARGAAAAAEIDGIIEEILAS
jgi:chromosome partitioning protein